MAATRQPQTWHHADSEATYQISTDPKLLDHAFINEAFASEAMHWAQPQPQQNLQLMLANSLTLGLYISVSNIKPPKSSDEPDSPRTPSPNIEGEDDILEQIGMARLVTDHVTVVYFTDMYILDAYRGRGLGKWTMKCIADVCRSMPALRTVLLLTRNVDAARLYEKELGMKDVMVQGGGLRCMTRKGYEDQA